MHALRAVFVLFNDCFAHDTIASEGQAEPHGDEPNINNRFFKILALNIGGLVAKPVSKFTNYSNKIRLRQLSHKYILKKDYPTPPTWQCTLHFRHTPGRRCVQAEDRKHLF